MTDLNGCHFPDTLHYDTQNHVWYAPDALGGYRVGLTQVAVALASQRIFAVTPKRLGRSFERGRSAATIESSKWVGPMRLAFDGVVEGINDAVQDRPDLVVADPYGAGWVMRVVTAAPDPLAGLVSGAAVGPAYAAWMQANDFPGCAPQQ
jgi:glycine cleavage system H protein